MNQAESYRNTAELMRLIAEVSKSLSQESIVKVFSEKTFQKAAKCKNTNEFLAFLQSLELPELKGKFIQQREGGGTHEILDNLLSKGQIPSNEDIAASIHALTHPSRDLISSVANGAAVGATAGAAYGTVGGVISGGIGAIPGAIGGAIAGGIGGAIGGAINWATGRE